MKTYKTDMYNPNDDLPDDNFDDDIDDDFDEDESDECDQDSDGICTMIGTEYCDWVCPFNKRKDYKK